VARESTASRRERREFDELEQKNKKLEAEPERTRLALDIVGKAHALELLPRPKAYARQGTSPTSETAQRAQ
jgi:hypothetical protein